MPEGFRIPVLVTLRAMPDIESEVPSRLIVPGVPGMPVPLEPEAVRPRLAALMAPPLRPPDGLGDMPDALDELG